MQGRKNQRGARSKYSASFKREIVRDYLEGDQSYQQVSEKYGLKNKDTVKMFVREHRQKSPHNQDPVPQRPMNESEKAENESLRKRIKKLERQVEQANLRAFAFDTMIDVAEEELGIEIRKKSAAKQSQK